MNLLIVKMMFCICTGDKKITFIELLPKCSTKMPTKKKKALCWIVIEIMSVLIREGPVALLW